MIRYSGPQKARICEEYAANGFTMRSTQRSLRRKYDINPTHVTIRRIYDNFLQNGSASLPRGGSVRSVRTPNNIRKVREAVQALTLEERPSSIRRIAREVNIPQASVHRILRKDLKFNPYHQELKESDFEKIQH
uniref:Uncharacterized protein n=1 Tax=Tetranychus urticae TaxID=32264 RepID=T1L5P0_TETUR